jgi:hypothetical protein
MQALAIVAIAAGAVMLAGVSVTLVRERRRAAETGTAGRWNRHGSVPLAAAGLALGAIARTGSGQTSVTHVVMFTVTTVLLGGALLCAVAAATTAAAAGRRPDSDQA